MAYTGCGVRIKYTQPPTKTHSTWVLETYNELFSEPHPEELVDFYRVTEDEGGGDTIDSNAKHCGDLTDRKLFIFLCKACARKNGLKW